MHFRRIASILAIYASSVAFAAPLEPTNSDFSIVDSAERYEASLQQISLPSVTTPEEVIPTRLQEATGEGGFPMPPGAQPIGLLTPPPIFDPPEQRPESIFAVAEEGLQNLLPKPFSVSGARPEHLSDFDGGNQPKNTPYPPDFSDLARDAGMYSCTLWQTLLKVTGAIIFVIFVSTALALLLERLFTCRRGRSATARINQHGGILEEELLLDEKHRRSRSNSPRPAVWSGTLSAGKISMA